MKHAGRVRAAIESRLPALGLIASLLGSSDEWNRQCRHCHRNQYVPHHFLLDWHHRSPHDAASLVDQPLDVRRERSPVSYPAFPSCLPRMAPLYTREPPSPRNFLRSETAGFQDYVESFEIYSVLCPDDPLPEKKRESIVEVSTLPTLRAAPAW